MAHISLDEPAGEEVAAVGGGAASGWTVIALAPSARWLLRRERVT
jgi:hypothetical protein